MGHWKGRFGADIIDFDYDTLVNTPQRAAAELFRRLGLQWEPRFLDFPRTTDPVKTASVWQVREPLYQHASGRARHYERELAPLRAYLHDLLGGTGATGG
jgi:hypothetical protein